MRAVGNAAGTGLPSRSELCGRCGDQRAAVPPDGDMAVCEIGRFLTTGNVQEADLASVLSGPRWAEVSASVPRHTGPTSCHPDCQPANPDSCDPGKNTPCDPMGYAPATDSPVAAVPALA
ncbi:SPASM domain-containing protein [Streptomyces sp. NPDC057939]|uniref:SPASM domain-containing protein n=1 Tax=Streptomyces sp. NPDC057939 TaxID=3346284 RepID=UPI0036E55D0A